MPRLLQEAQPVLAYTKEEHYGDCEFLNPFCPL